MLMRLDSRLARRLLAEVQKSANLITEIRERTIIDSMFLTPSHRHVSIISYYDISGIAHSQNGVSFGIKKKPTRTAAEIPPERAMHTRQILNRKFRAKASLRCGFESRSR